MLICQHRALISSGVVAIYFTSLPVSDSERFVLEPSDDGDDDGGFN